MTESSGKFYYTVRHYDVSEDVIASLGFDEEGRSWYLYAVPRMADRFARTLEAEGMQLYCPTMKKEILAGGRKIVREIPKIPRYTFVLSTFEQVESFAKRYQVKPVMVRREAGERLAYDKIYQTIPSSQMRSLMIVVECMEEEVEFVTPKSQYLERGDIVRVGGGEFVGVEGILQSNQGQRGGGRVYVDVGGVCTFSTATVPDEYIQVLAFARNSNHFYYKFKAVEELLEKAASTYACAGEPTSEELAALNFFLYRYECLGGLTYANEAKYVACRYAALMLVGRDADAEDCLADYQRRMQASKSARRSLRRSPAAQTGIDRWVERIAQIKEGAKSHPHP